MILIFSVIGILCPESCFCMNWDLCSKPCFCVIDILFFSESWLFMRRIPASCFILLSNDKSIWTLECLFIPVASSFACFVHVLKINSRTVITLDRSHLVEYFQVNPLFEWFDVYLPFYFDLVSDKASLVGTSLWGWCDVCLPYLGETLKQNFTIDNSKKIVRCQLNNLFLEYDHNFHLSSCDFINEQDE